MTKVIVITTIMMFMTKVHAIVELSKLFQHDCAPIIALLDYSRFPSTKLEFQFS